MENFSLSSICNVMNGEFPFHIENINILGFPLHNVTNDTLI